MFINKVYSAKLYAQGYLIFLTYPQFCDISNSSVFSFLYLNFELSIWKSLDLQKGCRASTEFPCTLHPASPSVDILQPVLINIGTVLYLHIIGTKL